MHGVAPIGAADPHAVHDDDDDGTTGEERGIANEGGDRHAAV